MAFFGYQTAGGTRLDTNRGIYYRIQASSAGSIVRAFAYIDSNSVSVNARAAIYASSAQDLTGVPTGASLGTSNNTAISNASGSPAWVQFDFAIPVVVTSGLYFHLFVGTDNAANWGCWYNDNNADNDSVESTAASNTTVPTTADISGPNTDWDVSFYVETSATSYTLTANNGVYTIAGQSSGLHVSRRVQAEVGAYTLTGLSTLIKTFISAATGSYSISGQEASLLYSGGGNRTLAADSGSYVITGVASSVVSARRVQADQGTHSLSGQSSNLVAARTLNLNQGSYALTGNAQNFYVAHIMQANQGAYNLSGQNATLTYSGFTPPSFPNFIFKVGGLKSIKHNFT